MDFYFTALLLGLGMTPLAFGVYLNVKVFHIPDITTDGSYTLGAVVFSIAILAGINPYAATILSLPAGALAGVFTGLIHTKLKVNAMLSGILVMTALYSVNLLMMGQSNIPLVQQTFIFFDTTQLNHLYYNLIIALILCLCITACLHYFHQSDAGIAMRATGGNEIMAKANGINNDNNKIAGLCIGNSLVALSGALIAQMQGFCDINMGIGIVISGLAAVMMAEAIIYSRAINKFYTQLLLVLCTITIYRLFIALVLSFGVTQVYVKLLTSLIVLVFIALTRFGKTSLKKL